MFKGMSVMFSLIMFTVCATPRAVFAVGSGAYENQVPSARSMGRANSVVASVDDSSAVSFNPARLTALNQNEVSLGVTLQDLKTKYESSSGANDDLDNDLAFTPNLHFASPLGSERWRFGIGLNYPHGIATNWKKTSPLRFIATETNLAIMDLNPVVAYKVNELFSVGGGLDYYRVQEVKIERQMNAQFINENVFGDPTPVSEANTTLEGDGDDIGATLGFSFTPHEQHLFGISYRSGAGIEVEGDIEIHNMSGALASSFGFDSTSYKGSVESKVYVPREVQLGYAYKPSNRIVIELDGQWTEWSVFRDQNVTFKEADPTKLALLSAGNPIPKNWKNSWSFGMGTEYMMNEKTALRFGYAFYDSPIPNSTFEASTPDSDMHMLASGIGLQFNKLLLDAAIQYYMLNDRKVNNDVGVNDGSNGDGVYKTTALYFALNLGYRFGGNQ